MESTGQLVRNVLRIAFDFPSLCSVLSIDLECDIAAELVLKLVPALAGEPAEGAFRIRNLFESALRVEISIYGN